MFCSNCGNKNATNQKFCGNCGSQFISNTTSTQINLNEINNSLNKTIETNKWIYSWPAIIIAFYLFFPVGIYLVYKRSTINRREVFTMGKTTSKIAIGFFFLAIFVIIAESFIMGTIFALIGGGLLFMAKKQQKKADIFRQYISLIVNREIECLNEITSKMKLEKDKVIQDIKELMKKNFLSNSYDLDLQANKVYCVNKAQMKKLEKKANTRVVKCPNCHANNKLTTKVGKCDYCQTYID